MTDIEGASVLAKRIQDKQVSINSNEVFTLTQSLVEIRSEEDIDLIIKTLYELNNSGLKSGGNCIKIEKL